MKNVVSVITTCCLTLFIAACSPSSDLSSAPPDSEPLKSSDVTHSGCKNAVTRNAWKEEMVLLKTINSKKLQINHVDAIFNCVPGDITIETVLSGNTIYVTEKEQQSAANCYCPYNLLFTVDLPSHGTYQLKINNVDFGTFTFNHDTDLTLTNK